MKINSRGNKPLSEINLRLNSVDTKMSHKFIPFSSNCIEMREFDPSAVAYIEFQDSREIDMLIDMLEQFKDKNRDYFGDWRL